MLVGDIWNIILKLTHNIDNNWEYKKNQTHNIDNNWEYEQTDRHSSCCLASYTQFI